IARRDLEAAVAAAIVDDDVLPVLVALAQDALDALGQIPLAVVDRRENRDERLFDGTHVIRTPRIRAFHAATRVRTASRRVRSGPGARPLACQTIRINPR